MFVAIIIISRVLTTYQKPVTKARIREIASTFLMELNNCQQRNSRYERSSRLARKAYLSSPGFLLEGVFDFKINLKGKILNKTQ